MYNRDFQSESNITGAEFERLVSLDLIARGYKIISCNTEIEGIGVNVDYIAEKDNEIEYGEAKGGKNGHRKRPGARRTCSVKKALCNGALLKVKNKNTRYVIYFSEKTKENSSADKMLKTAIDANFIAEVKYLNY